MDELGKLVEIATGQTCVEADVLGHLSQSLAAAHELDNHLFTRRVSQPAYDGDHLLQRVLFWFLCPI